MMPSVTPGLWSAGWICNLLPRVSVYILVLSISRPLTSSHSQVGDYTNDAKGRLSTITNTRDCPEY